MDHSTVGTDYSKVVKDYAVEQDGYMVGYYDTAGQDGVRSMLLEDPQDPEFNAFGHYFKTSLATWLPITAVWYVTLTEMFWVWCGVPRQGCS
jgi:hypothetical protein